ncbi:NAD(P)-dependent oxidoreductase [Histidinibacterium lentulum]|uniref:NAD(P)-dependent oxidoreductase n=1 Tax=Histidinibacterium lentulum TaxID=2480588 RepID=A0A3N2QVQ0_9RHOB|nr:NAD(P)-binding domain-containing protein [Histidinibacterium lentulum]ROT99115.1 NAD(P)-dependent oxidoreductase [Histidinibacterium lentulum]
MEPVGIAGCGTMGRPMLEALLDAGVDARGFDIRKIGHPAVTTDVAAFARGLATCLTVVRDEAETEALLFTDQALGSAPDLRTLVICSTLPPSYVRGLAPRLPHLDLVDAPMSGAEIGAVERTLSFMPGGDPATVARLMPLFRAMGRSVHPMGAFGMGILAKVLNNFVLSASVAATRTALDWADAADLPEAALLDLIEASTGRNWFASGRDDIEFFRDGFAPGNTIGILEKDVRCALDAAPGDADRQLAETLRASLRALTPRAAPRA